MEVPPWYCVRVAPYAKGNGSVGQGMHLVVTSSYEGGRGIRKDRKMAEPQLQKHKIDPTRTTPRLRDEPKNHLPVTSKLRNSACTIKATDEAPWQGPKPV